MTNKLIKGLVATAVLAALAGCNSNDEPIPTKPFDLTIAHINDTHSNFDPVKSSFKIGADGSTIFNEFGGYPRLLEAANLVKSQAGLDKQPLLFLHGGDAWQGTAYFKLNDGMANADLLSQMGLDAMVLGNHEFDLDTAQLAGFINGVNFPVLANNINTKEDASLNAAKNLIPYQIFAFNGDEKRKIASPSESKSNEQLVAVIGVVLEDMKTIATGTGDAIFSSEIESTQATIDMLKDMGVNKIVVLSHIGNARDVALAAGTRGIDIIVGGHSHTLLGDFTDLGHGNNGEYAQLVTQKDDTGVTCVVQAGEYAQAIGNVTISFDQDGELTSCIGTNTLLTNSEFYTNSMRQADQLIIGNQHEEVMNFVDSVEKIDHVIENLALRDRIDTMYKPALDKAYGDVITLVPTEINHERRPGDGGTDLHGSDVAPLVAEGLVYWANQESVQQVIGRKVDIGLVGAGGIRQNISAGDFREGHVSLELMPFSNYLSVLTVSGEVLKTLLMTTINATLPVGSHGGKFPYVGGMRYTFIEDIKHNSGHISELELNTGTESSPVWEKITDTSEYTLAVNNYNASGNDGWNALGDAQLVSTDRIDIVMNKDKYKAYPVSHLTFDGETYEVIYEDTSPSCGDDADICNTDAQSFIDYATSRVVLEALTFESTTVIYKD
ncbi:bifunctional metallophosphatase/5'-nucleotidase [Shewanella violacea]|uniref:5'-nucleotidase, putative n=1 Tax=Shewanella violacea (strain JCM 10179 / CIP 106290 / LMG 19151 / DSS12) TaxID=637905 RepID=D4ZLM0_SHEVD|nr:5'-nucleotidase C-terminal domain-containing protein [Shewanella violacea]BAJ02569.1 5'-nucleotidase, putative [Shewanella violacea DSS12]